MKRAKFNLIPMGNKFKYRIRGKVFCTKQKEFFPNSDVQPFGLGWNWFFKTKNEYERFLKKNRTIKKVVNLSDTLYSNCDIII